MKILSIDSSTKAASAAIVENGKILAEYFLNTGFTHSQTLIPIIDHVLKESGSMLNDMDFSKVDIPETKARRRREEPLAGAQGQSAAAGTGSEEEIPF